MKLYRALQSQGFGSRKGCVAQVRAGAVAVNGAVGDECSNNNCLTYRVFSMLPPTLLQSGMQCVGRLDQDTTGLLLFSDDGQFIHRMISPKKGIAKIYRAACAEPVTDAMLDALRQGVTLNDEPAP